MSHTEDNCIQQVEEYRKHRLEFTNRTWSKGLSWRVFELLYWGGFCSREMILEAYLSGKIYPGQKGESGYPRNYGWVSHKEVAKWLGLPEPKKPNQRTCRHCGRILAEK